MMTRLWPEGVPVEVVGEADGAPQAFTWRGRRYTVAGIALRWRVRADWWTDEAWREYFKLTTVEGQLCTLYRDLKSGEWFCARLYD
jgi:hypothetical protein